MRLFRIVRNEYWDEYGQLARTHWTVQKRCKILWWYYWHTIEYQTDYDYTYTSKPSIEVVEIPF